MIEFLLSVAILLGLTFGAMVLLEVYHYLSWRRARGRFLQEHKNRLTDASDDTDGGSGTDAAN